MDEWHNNNGNNDKDKDAGKGVFGLGGGYGGIKIPKRSYKDYLPKSSGDDKNIRNPVNGIIPLDYKKDIPKNNNPYDNNGGNNQNNYPPDYGSNNNGPSGRNKDLRINNRPLHGYLGPEGGLPHPRPILQYGNPNTQPNFGNGNQNGDNQPNYNPNGNNNQPNNQNDGSGNYGY